MKYFDSESFKFYSSKKEMDVQLHTYKVLAKTKTKLSITRRSPGRKRTQPNMKKSHLQGPFYKTEHNPKKFFLVSEVSVSPVFLFLPWNPVGINRYLTIIFVMDSTLLVFSKQRKNVCNQFSHFLFISQFPQLNPKSLHPYKWVN